VGNVAQEDIADLGPLVPAEHGIDGLGQFGAAALVDAARIDPDPFEIVRGRLLAALSDLGVASLGLAHRRSFLQVDEGDLVVTPCVREDGVRRDLVAEELGGSQRRNVKESHCALLLRPVQILAGLSIHFIDRRIENGVCLAGVGAVQPWLSLAQCQDFLRQSKLKAELGESGTKEAPINYEIARSR
jgi:hypothetical protein